MSNLNSLVAYPLNVDLFTNLCEKKAVLPSPLPQLIIQNSCWGDYTLFLFLLIKICYIFMIIAGHWIFCGSGTRTFNEGSKNFRIENHVPAGGDSRPVLQPYHASGNIGENVLG